MNPETDASAHCWLERSHCVQERPDRRTRWPVAYDSLREAVAVDAAAEVVAAVAVDVVAAADDVAVELMISLELTSHAVVDKDAVDARVEKTQLLAILAPP